MPRITRIAMISVRCRPAAWLQTMGIDGLMPGEPQQPGELLGQLHEKLQDELGLPAMPVAVGIHDSNAALFTVSLGSR